MKAGARWAWEVTMPNLSFPNESAEYRSARNALLDAWIALNRQLYVQEGPGQHRRAGGLINTSWKLLDMSADCRGDFFPRLNCGARAGPAS
jgi:hypothetical protein